MIKIISNKIQCNYCGDILESDNTHDYKVCKCGKCACMGGHSELKRDYVYSHSDYTELSETIEVADEIERGVDIFNDEYNDTDFPGRGSRKCTKQRKSGSIGKTRIQLYYSKDQ